MTISTKRFASGNEAVIDAALAAGCHFFAGYPVTPATEILEAAAEKFPEHDRVMVPTEGEIAAIHMVAGASLAGFRAMTATAPLGLSLMSEALSFFSGMTELPGVVVVQQRWGPGDGSLGPGQDGYNQATRGCGHGDFKMIVLAPKNVQELADLTIEAFDLAEKYGLFVLVLGDQLLAIASEQYTTAEPTERPPRAVEFGQDNGIVMPELVAVDETAGDFAALERVGRRWEQKYALIERDEARAERSGDDGAVDLLIVAYGSLARIAEYAAPQLRGALGIRVAVIRPITLWPFPRDAMRSAAADAGSVIVAELSMGQMIDDVAEAIGRRPDGFVNWLGGRAPSVEEFAERVCERMSALEPGGRPMKVVAEPSTAALAPHGFDFCPGLRIRIGPAGTHRRRRGDGTQARVHGRHRLRRLHDRAHARRRADGSARSYRRARERLQADATRSIGVCDPRRRRLHGSRRGRVVAHRGTRRADHGHRLEQRRARGHRRTVGRHDAGGQGHQYDSGRPRSAARPTASVPGDAVDAERSGLRRTGGDRFCARRAPRAKGHCQGIRGSTAPAPDSRSSRCSARARPIGEWTRFRRGSTSANRCAPSIRPACWSTAHVAATNERRCCRS